MLSRALIIYSTVLYIGFLFLVAWWGDKARLRDKGQRRLQQWIYPLSLAVYCTSWTFFGSVGLASRQGYDFLAIYLGPIVVYTLGAPLLKHIIRLAKAQNISSTADFIGARYGKNPIVAAIVCVIALIAVVPYLALQLKAIASSLVIVMPETESFNSSALALTITVMMIFFSIFFGTRHADATEHQHGLILSIAVESVVKLLSFLAVGFYISYIVFSGPNELFARAQANPDIRATVFAPPDVTQWITLFVLSSGAALLLPRMFHVAVVENNNEKEVDRARWVFPLYLVLINLFVLPLALAGLLTFPTGSVSSDMMVLALPLHAGSEIFTLLAFIGGLSAATAMVIVASVALAIMLSNDIALPILLKFMGESKRDLMRIVLYMRRTLIALVLLLAYLYYHETASSHLAAIGLMSFAAIIQLAPAFFGGLLWRGGNARGAIAGMLAGIFVWAYTLFLPSFSDFKALNFYDAFGIEMLNPQALFGSKLPSLAHGSFWSLFFNLAFYIGFSLTRIARPIEMMQAQVFVPVPSHFRQINRNNRTAIPYEELERTLARYLGLQRTKSNFESFAKAQGLLLTAKTPVEFVVLRYAENLLASAIGTASSRLVLSTLLKKSTSGEVTALRLLDEAQAVMHYNRELLHSALEHAHQGIAVFDVAHNLMLWNKSFTQILDLPLNFLRVGMSYEQILRQMGKQGEFGEGEVEAIIAMRVERFFKADQPYISQLVGRGMVIEIANTHLPDGGLVATYTDITQSVDFAKTLEEANVTLEKRVHERTQELAIAKDLADKANLSKTRFIAAASHDILQPLNAARLYTTALVERSRHLPQNELASKIDASLESVEEILGALLDISRLDAGAMKPEWTSFSLQELFDQLELEYRPFAMKKGIELRFVTTHAIIYCDRRLLRRILQNFISNALKYTLKGKVLIGLRKRGKQAVLHIYDTGIGIAKEDQPLIFQEFQRLERGARVATGLGLGLSIVERMCRVLKAPLTFHSALGVGTVFRLELQVSPLTSVSVTQMNEQAVMGLAGLRVLVIDNEPRILEGMTLLLTGWGCEVMQAKTLKSFYATLEDDNYPDALLIDYHLDDNQNGLETIQQLRDYFLSPTLPATLITAERSLELREKAAQHDIHVLNKPLKPAQLRALLAKWRGGM